MPTSPNNPHLKLAAHLLRSANERRKSSQTVIEGAHLIEMYAAKYGAPETVIADTSAEEKILAVAPGATLLSAPENWFAQNAPAAQGALAVIPVPKATRQFDAFNVLLEDVQDPGNVGAILRSAASAGVKNVFLTKHCASAWQPKVLRAAQGAHFLLDIAEDADAIETAEALRVGRVGRLIVTLPRAADSIFNAPLKLDPRHPLMLAVGNEGAGISEELSQIADLRVRIPMPGAMESLNVAAATAIVLFETVRQNIDSGDLA
jgi:TrmH family RNA methyltransferase